MTQLKLPIEAYEKEFNDEVNFFDHIIKVFNEFKQQPWVKALFLKRDLDFKHKIPMAERVLYEVTEQQLHQVHRIYGKNVNALYGYILIVISELEYMQKFFPEGERIDPYAG